MFSILVCEDERNIRRLMCEYLLQDGYTVFESSNGEEALEVMDVQHIDLLITDIMMPVMDGFGLVTALREADCGIPVLMITAKGSMDDKKAGFGSGADDYMVKPIDMEEMLLRVSALLRRAKATAEKRITVGGTVIDYDGFSVETNGGTMLLPNKEFRILFKLLSQPNRIFTRAQLMDEIWGYENDSTERTVDVHIRHLREKFADNTDFEIVTVKGLGYKAAVRKN